LAGRRFIMRGLLGGRCLTVCSAVLVSLGTGILAPATRGEAAAKKPTAVSVTLEATSAGPDTVLAALDNGLVVSGRCRSLTSTVEVSLKLAPEAGFPPGMQVSGFSFVGSLPILANGFTTPPLEQSALIGANVAFALIAARLT
jgi:hypothetical protein